MTANILRQWALKVTHQTRGNKARWLDSIKTKPIDLDFV